MGANLSAAETNTDVWPNTGKTKICKLYKTQTTHVLEAEGG